MLFRSAYRAAVDQLHACGFGPGPHSWDAPETREDGVYAVQMTHASSPTGEAYVGPELTDGWKAAVPSMAYQFSTLAEAQRIADQWRGTLGMLLGKSEIGVVELEIGHLEHVPFHGAVDMPEACHG